MCILFCNAYYYRPGTRVLWHVHLLKQLGGRGWEEFIISRNIESYTNTKTKINKTALEDGQRPNNIRVRNK